MASATDFPVRVRANRADAPFVDVRLPKSATMTKLRKLCSSKTKVRVRRVFLHPSGEEVFNVDEIPSAAELVVTSGEEYVGANGETSSSKSRAGSDTDALTVAVLGSGGVGKSALTLRYVRDFFVTDWDPTIEDAYRKQVTLDGKTTPLEILDTAGQDDFESLRHQWMMDKSGYIFVYALDDPKSLDDLDSFFGLHTMINISKSTAIPMILVANKNDLESTPDIEKLREAGRAKADDIGAAFMETSAFSGDNVREVFEAFVRMCRGSGNLRSVKKGQSCAVS